MWHKIPLLGLAKLKHPGPTLIRKKLREYTNENYWDTLVKPLDWQPDHKKALISLLKLSALVSCRGCHGDYFTAA